jgi:hypothetical protein
MSLLVVPKRMADEGPCGFRFRLAASNLLSIQDLAQLEVNSQIEPTRAQASSCVPIGEGAFNPWVRRWSRFCPRCLAGRQCWRIGWEILFADACAACGCWLVDTCSACATPTSWKRDHLLQCNCGTYLIDEYACAAPIAVFRLSQALQEVALGGKPTVLPAFHDLSLTQCVRLVRLLGTYGSSDGRSVPQKVEQVDTLRVSWPITSMAAEILESWPSGLTSLLEKLRAHGSAEDKGKLSKAFSGFYSALYDGFKDAEFDFLRAAFENYVAEHWTGALGKRNRRLDESVLRTVSWIPANHACGVLAVSRRRLNDLIDEGRLQGERRQTAAHREFIVVKRSDVETLALTREDGFSLLEASLRLGLKKQRLLSLLPIICPQAKKLGAQGCPWAIPANWMERWETLIQNQAQAEPMESKKVALGHLVRYWPWTNEQIGLLLVDILNGDLMPAGVLKSGKGVGALVLHVHDLDHWFAGKQRVPCAELTIPDIALRMEIKQEVVYALVRSGLLQSSSRKVGRRTEQRVKALILEEFEQRYILGRDIAQLLGRSPRAVAEFLLSDGVRPVAGPGVDKCRQNVFRRDAIDECLRRHGLEFPVQTSLRQGLFGLDEPCLVTPANVRDKKQWP